MLGERSDELGCVQVGLVADRDGAREAEAEVGEQQPDLERDVAALRDEPDRPARQRRRRKVQLGSRVEDPEAVRPDERRAGRADALDDRRLARRALGSLLAEPSGDRYERTRAGGQRVVDRLLEPVAGTLRITSSGACGRSARLR